MFVFFFCLSSDRKLTQLPQEILACDHVVDFFCPKPSDGEQETDSPRPKCKSLLTGEVRSVRRLSADNVWEVDIFGVQSERFS